MKQEFAKYMLDKDFKNAAILIFEATFKVQVPNNVNLNINIDRNKNIEDLAMQMKNCYDQIDKEYSAISFEKTLTNVLNSEDLLGKQNIKDNETIMNNAKTLFDETMKNIKKRQYEQIFDSTVLTLNATLQGFVNAAMKLN